MLESTLELGECFFAETLPSVLVPLRIESALEIFDTKADAPMRRRSGRKIGNEAHTILMPAWTVVHTSVFEYDGTRLFFLKPSTTRTRPVKIVLFLLLVDVTSR